MAHLGLLDLWVFTMLAAVVVGLCVLPREGDDGTDKARELGAGA